MQGKEKGPDGPKDRRSPSTDVATAPPGANAIQCNACDAVRHTTEVVTGRAVTR